jgi:hypothetical protein
MKGLVALVGFIGLIVAGIVDAINIFTNPGFALFWIIY